MSDTLHSRRYLGDSVYAEIEDGMLKLTTNNGYADDPRNVIFMERFVVKELMDFVRAIDPALVAE